MGDNKKLKLGRYTKSPKGIMEFAHLLETASPELKERMIEQCRKENPVFLDTVLAQVAANNRIDENTELKLDRFKKSQSGVLEFARLLEQSAPGVRDSIIARAQKQDSEFVLGVLRRTVYFDEINLLDEGVLAEILSETPPKILAYALHGTEAGFREKIMANVGHRSIRQVKDEEENFGEGGPPEGLILGARKHILKIGRTLEEKGKFDFALLSSPRIDGYPPEVTEDYDDDEDAA